MIEMQVVHIEKGSVVLSGQLIEHMKANGGRITIGYSDQLKEWIAGYEFGREAEDSDVAGGAAYGRSADHEESATERATVGAQVCIDHIEEEVGIK